MLFIIIILIITTHHDNTHHNDTNNNDTHHNDTIIKRVSWFKSSLLLRIQSDSFTNINS